MEIVFTEPEKNLHAFPERWFADQSRYERITSVRFMGSNRLMVADRQASKMYYVEYDLAKKSSRMLDQITLRDIHVPSLFFNRNTQTAKHFPTLIRVHGDIVYYADLENRVGRVRIVGDKLVLLTPITFPIRAHFHGVTFHPRDPNFMFLTGAVDHTKMVTYHLITKELKEYQLPGLEKMKLKQLDFIGPDLFAVSATTGNIEDARGSAYDGAIAVYRTSTNELVDIVRLPEGHLDDLRVDGNVLYVAYQANDPYGKILKYVFENGKITYDTYYRVQSFPHGVDVKGNMLAAACLKTHSVCMFFK